jgi:hypothetical protein
VAGCVPDVGIVAGRSGVRGGRVDALEGNSAAVGGDSGGHGTFVASCWGGNDGKG